MKKDDMDGGKMSLGDRNVDGMIILKWIFRAKRVECGLDSAGSEYGSVTGFW
jgi:hypothetical protein